MPSKSSKQAKFMAIAAHNPAFALKAGIPVSVARELYEADNAKKSVKRDRPKWGLMFNPGRPPG